MAVPARRSLAGFTLVELMVALVISGILATVIFEFLLGQVRLARYQAAREEVQQNARAALDLLAGELRGVLPAGITVAQPNAIGFYLPRAWGVLCNNLTAASTVAWVRFAAGDFPEDYPAASPAPASWGLGVAQTADPSQTPPGWQFVAPLANTTTVNPCNAALQPPDAAGQVVERGFAASGFVPFNSNLTVAAGSRVLVYQEVGYDVSTSNVPGHWIRRNTQPMAGPLAAANGLRFTYLDVLGNALAQPFSTASIARVRVEVTTRSQARFNDQPQVTTAATDVSLRNHD